MEKTIELSQRAGHGKGEARKLRFDQQIPGICYGKHLKNPIPVSVDKVKISNVLRTSNQNELYTVDSTDSNIKGQIVLIKSKQLDPLTDDLIHIDFLAVNKNEPIRTTVSVELVGKAKGVAEGGILQQPNRTLDIRCLPHLIPSKIKADVTELMINDSLHVTDIQLPEGVEVLGAANKTLAVVIPPQEEEVQAVQAAEVKEVEVSSGKGKKEEEGEAEGDKKE
ncbi:MAG: 50S ribosomal protein L25 [Bdellovibrionales bacterium]|nr:50S ribosomal protein L25 [Bdellovibrionales bacterium]